MAILLSPWKAGGAWAQALRASATKLGIELALHVHPDPVDPVDVRYLIAWKHDAADVRRYPNLRAILSAGAGIEQFMTQDYPAVPVVRLADPAMSDEMAQYAVHWVTHFQRRFDVIAEQQADALWAQPQYVPAGEHPVGVLGYGTIGRRIGDALRGLGYPVHAWSRSGTDDANVTSHAGLDNLSSFLGACLSVVNVLPSSDSTRGVLNAQRFAQFRPGSVLINVGRGATVDEVALIDALDNGPVSQAVLDVTATEPLPAESPLWNHPAVHITPHMAGNTQMLSSALLMMENIARMERGEDPFPMLNRSRGY